MECVLGEISIIYCTSWSGTRSISILEYNLTATTKPPESVDYNLRLFPQLLGSGTVGMKQLYHAFS